MMTNLIQKKDKEEKELKANELDSKMWKHVEVSKENPIDAPLHTSTFSTRFANHRETYIRQNFNKIRIKLKEYGIHIEANYNHGTLSVATTNKTWDPFAIIKAKDFIRLIARYVPYEYAQRVLQDDIYSDIIEISKCKVASNQLRFIKRRARLIGPNGVTLKAIEILTKCYILVYGGSVCTIGSSKGIQEVRKIVLDCMNNVHPIYQLKRLMVLRELETNPELKNESWNRFLPTFKKYRQQQQSSNGFNKFDNRPSRTINEIKRNLKKKNNPKNIHHGHLHQHQVKLI